MNRRESGRRRRRRARLLAGGLAVGVLAAAFPAGASAADYCVKPSTRCGGNALDSLQQAFALADDTAGLDRIFLGAKDYYAPGGGYSYVVSGSPIELIGEGSGKTVVTGIPGSGGVMLQVVGGPGTAVRDLTVRLPESAQTNTTGLWTDGVARQVQIDQHPTQQTTSRNGVWLQYGGMLVNSTVTLDAAAGGSNGVVLGPGDPVVRESAIKARMGVLSNFGGRIERSRITSLGSAGVRAVRGVTTVNGSLIRFDGDTGGISVDVSPGFDSTVNADGVTIVGPYKTESAGVFASTFADPTRSATVNLTNSVIRGVESPVYARATGSGNASVNVSYSDYDASANVIDGAVASVTETNVSNVGDAGFANPAGADYHLLPGSALVDRGNPATAQGLDLDGNPLVADGDGDGTPRRDLGAFELPAGAAGTGPGGGGSTGGGSGSTPPPDTMAPLITGFRATPKLFAIARASTPVAAALPRGTRFRYVLSEDARVTLTIQRALPGRRSGGKCRRPRPALRRAKRCARYVTIGALKRTGRSGANTTRFSGRLGKRTLRRGGYRALIVAVDAAGNRSARRTVRFRVADS